MRLRHSLFSPSILTPRMYALTHCFSKTEGRAAGLIYGQPQINRFLLILFLLWHQPSIASHVSISPPWIHARKRMKGWNYPCTGVVMGHDPSGIFTAQQGL